MSDIHSNAEAYVLGGLDAADTAEFEQHLGGCGDCRAEVAALRELTADLSETVATDPPPALRASILAEIATTPQEGPAGRHAAPAEPTMPRTDTAANVVPIRRSRGSRVVAVVAAAAAVAAIAVGGWAINSRNDARDETAAAHQQIEQLSALLAAPDVQTASTPASDGGTATVVRSADQGVAMLVGSGLPELSDDQVYEAWTFDGKTAVAAGTFTPAATDVTHRLPAAGVDTSTVAVTVEPEGGSDAPTSDPIAVIDLS